MGPKDCGNSLEDCIEYVRQKMYLEEKKPKKNESEDELDADSENEDVLVDNVADKNSTKNRCLLQQRMLK